MQLAFVPQDINLAIQFWTETIGAGPFFQFPHVEYQRFHDRGQPQEIDFTVFIGYWQDLQIELIQQHNDAPSTYKRWLNDGRQGLHHVCICVDDMTAVRDLCAQTGAKIEQELFMENAEAIYVDSGGGPGTLMEFFRASRRLLDAFEIMRLAAQSWDGSVPVRTMGPAPVG